MHHLELDHIGIDSELLQQATLARETKKQLGDYINIETKGAGFECSICFEIFDNVDKLNTHGIYAHQKEINPEFIKDLKEMNDSFQDSPPTCKRCNRKFLGLVTTRINKEIQHVCFDCYEKYFGKNALNRITIGTPDDVLKKMRRAL